MFKLNQQNKFKLTQEMPLGMVMAGLMLWALAWCA